MIPPQVKQVMQLVRGYLVGGPVRDILMGKVPNDYDIATPYTPKEVEKILHLHGIKTYEVGKRFGTVGAIVPSYKIEITTFRKETYDFVSRKPRVVFTRSILKDLARRDFTINAMAMDINGNIIDPFGGQRDIQRGMIQFVGNPEKRILEDPLRILRAFRFAARYGFSIDPKSLEAIKKLLGELKRISKERIKDEFLKAAETNRFYLYCQYNYQYRIFQYYGPTWAKVMPLMSKIKHSPGYGHYGESVWQHTIDVLKRMDEWAYPARLKIAGFFHDVGKVETAIEKRGRIHFYEHEKAGVALARQMMRELKFSNLQINYVAFIVANHMRIGFAIKEYEKGNKRTIIRLFAKAKLEGYSKYLVDLIKHYEADSGEKAPPEIYGLAKTVITTSIPKFPPELAKRIPPNERRNYIYGRLVEKILKIQ